MRAFPPLIYSVLIEWCRATRGTAGIVRFGHHPSQSSRETVDEVDIQALADDIAAREQRYGWMLRASRGEPCLEGMVR